MKKGYIRFAPDILRRLGEELNPNPDKGILELVKNAYDADALKCTVTLTNTEKSGGAITIEDDGDGMDVEDILSGWLVLGKSGKSTKQKTRLGRTPSGSKGLGRLAALRLGSKAMLTTHPKGDDKAEHNLLIDWDDFDNVDLIDEVPLAIETAKLKHGCGSGTTIRLENLDSHVTHADARRLARELILLADPFGDSPEGFKPTLVAPEFADIEKLVQKRYFDDAEYHLIASLDNQGKGVASVVDWQGKILFAARHSDLAGNDENKPYQCPPAEFNLWVFILDSATFTTRISSINEVKTWLGSFGGIHLYQNGIRVSPYGDPANDWLDLNLRRVRNPEERPSTNTVIGRIVVSDREDLLVQKTDRSGFIETEAFHELRRFAIDATEWLARRRMDVAQVRRAKERSAALSVVKPSQQTLFETIDKAPPKVREKIKRALEAHERAHITDKEKLRKEIQLYRTLSTAGITTATFAHESRGNPIKAITFAINTIERRARAELGSNYAKTLEKPVETIKGATDGLAVLGAATFKLLDHDKRRLSHVDLHQVMKELIETFEPFTSGRDIKIISTPCAGSPYLRGSNAAIESVFTNLINNSVTAFETSDVSNRQIHIRTEVHEGVFTLRVLDNGPGITGIKKSDIWLPGETTRRNGTGLGLAIVKDTVADLGGDVDAVEHSELGGAEIIIKLPILGK
jgi:signal transduction histidine kinase